MIATDKLRQLAAAIERQPDFQPAGPILRAQGALTARISAEVGELCRIVSGSGPGALAEVIGFDGDRAQVMPLRWLPGVGPSARVVPLGRRLSVPVGTGLLGRVIDTLGHPLDDRGPLRASHWSRLVQQSPSPLSRQKISKILTTGKRPIDGLLTIGVGQRIGLFAGSGVGKSTLLGEIAQSSDADVNVVALVGERGREVRPFIEDCLGPAGLQRSIVVVATADQPPLAKIRAAQSAITIADWFRQRGQHVLLMLDSLTRVAAAARELGLLLGEPPSARGYPPSAFQLMSRLAEYLGTDAGGAITGILTVLVDGDDATEPVADAARGTLDGHIVMDRKLAERGHFPAINISASISRVAMDIVPQQQRAAATAIREVLATYEEVADMIRIGAYKPGTSPQVDAAIKLLPLVHSLLRQPIGDTSPLAQTQQAMTLLASRWQQLLQEKSS